MDCLKFKKTFVFAALAISFTFGQSAFGGGAQSGRGSQGEKHRDHFAGTLCAFSASPRLRVKLEYVSDNH